MWLNFNLLPWKYFLFFLSLVNPTLEVGCIALHLHTQPALWVSRAFTHRPSRCFRNSLFFWRLVLLIFFFWSVPPLPPCLIEETTAVWLADVRTGDAAVSPPTSLAPVVRSRVCVNEKKRKERKKRNLGRYGGSEGSEQDLSLFAGFSFLTNGPHKDGASKKKMTESLFQTSASSLPDKRFVVQAPPAWRIATPGASSGKKKKPLPNATV